jgi:hypothetical protein
MYVDPAYVRSLTTSRTYFFFNTDPRAVDSRKHLAALLIRG